MKVLLAVLVGSIFFINGCASVPPGQIKKQSAPGQVKKNTGYNPASGKIKVK